LTPTRRGGFHLVGAGLNNFAMSQISRFRAFG
jgi:hypothetical protein